MVKVKGRVQGLDGKGFLTKGNGGGEIAAIGLRPDPVQQDIRRLGGGGGRGPERNLGGRWGCLPFNLPDRCRSRQKRHPILQARLGSIERQRRRKHLP